MPAKHAAATKVSKGLLDKLNDAIAREIAVSIQYMWQHVQWGGVRGFAVHDELRAIAIAEMKHAEAIAERLFYLGAIPTTKPAPIFVGDSLKQMIEANIQAEAEAIALYKDIVEMARQERDETTNRLFREILQQEEDHHDTFTTLMEDME